MRELKALAVTVVGALLFMSCRREAHHAEPASTAIWSWFDLPRDDERSHNLSGLVWDEGSRSAYAIQDKSPIIITLVPDAELRKWRFGDAINVDIPGPHDLEALALLPDGFIVANEAGPHVFEIDRAGHARRELALPPELSSAIDNKSLESVAVTPDRRFVFTANEVALPGDGPVATASLGTRIRIVRLDRATGEITEHGYTTDRAACDGADYGVADVAALSDSALLVLERGWAAGVGNTVRVYHVKLSQGPATKSLLVDLATLDVRGLGLPPTKEAQPTPLMDNFEAVALGPRLPDGRASLLLVTDDNMRPQQVARVLVVALAHAVR